MRILLLIKRASSDFYFFEETFKWILTVESTIIKKIMDLSMLILLNKVAYEKKKEKKKQLLSVVL